MLKASKYSIIYKLFIVITSVLVLRTILICYLLAEFQKLIPNFFPDAVYLSKIYIQFLCK